MATGYADGLVFPLPTLLAGDVEANLTAPPPTLSAGDAGAELTAPTPELEAESLSDNALFYDEEEDALTGPVSFPTPTLAAEMGPVGQVGSLSAQAPAPSLSAFADGSEILTFAGTAPAPTLESGTADLVVTAPVPAVSIAVLTGELITVSASAPAPILSAVLDNPALITFAGSAILPLLDAALAPGQIITAALIARAPTLSATGLTGNVATLLAVAATPIMDAAGYPAYTITFAGAAPAPRLDAALSAALLAAYRTWALNVRKGALTEYDNFEFNSFAVFNGVVLAAGSSGVVALGTQDADGSTAIDAVFTTGQDAFGSSVHKRVPRIYVGGSASGDMLFSTITTEGGTRQYALNWNGITGTQQRRVGVGKGPKSRYWQFSVENVAGADFSINDVLVYPTKLRRRVM